MLEPPQAFQRMLPRGFVTGLFEKCEGKGQTYQSVSASASALPLKTWRHAVGATGVVRVWGYSPLSSVLSLNVQHCDASHSPAESGKVKLQSGAEHLQTSRKATGMSSRYRRRGLSSRGEMQEAVCALAWYKG